MGDNAPTWKFNQCFGEKTVIDDVTEQDILSAVEFNQTGDYLATGDKAGRIVVFEIDHPNAGNSGKGTRCANGSANGGSPPVFATSASVLRSNNNVNANGDVNKISKTKSCTSCEYKFQCEFQSHEPEFDYLKSLEIEEKINKIKWCRPSNDSLFLLSTNDKTIKLWKAFEKKVLALTSFNLPEQSRAVRRTGSLSSWTGDGENSTVKHFNSVNTLKLPDVALSERLVSSTPRKVYSNAHAYHVNSIAVNSDGETFLSADDLRINLWNLHLSDQSFNIVDIKPENMEELQEVITGAEFHPSHCNIFMYSSSRGSIKLADMRERALCDLHAKLFEEPEQPGNKSFFSEIIASLSDIKFTSDGRYIISRDFLTLKVWDINMESRPIQTINIHEHLRSKLCDLYENECIFDKFEVAVSGDGSNMATGSYNNTFHIFDRHGKTDVCIEASKMESSKSILTEEVTSSVSSSHIYDDDEQMQLITPSVKTIQNYVPASVDFNQKALHLGFHPLQSCVAVACVNNLYLYGT
uniref:Serine/threonine-protein phosphatase 2A 55 kDa regulatory subunit B n=1 Tax=Aplanochytrium stocchinoi TaxID=215587 RepID=A0A7S3V1J7_9STRA|mmetsp:Transcript_4998/g.6505  ORF Transcript_4998/g.6505 Transcript_4998/m.6505 type:complete len:524 (+) Transcript_4998:479-2050(+)